MDMWVFRGAVIEFGRVLTSNYYCETRAVSQEKAENNIKYRYKKEHNKAPYCKIELRGTLEKIEEES